VDGEELFQIIAIGGGMGWKVGEERSITIKLLENPFI
jgi:hypothetical protein